MVDRPFLGSQRWQEQQWRADREGAHPSLVSTRAGMVGFEKAFIRRMANLGVPMFAAEVLRTPERQADLKAMGNSRAGPGQSPHQYGCAVDIVHSVHGWGLDRKAWQAIGHIGKELALQRGFKLTWGGDWEFWDPAHWELTEWREVKRLIDADPSMWPNAQAVFDWKEADKRARQRLA